MASQQSSTQFTLPLRLRSTPSTTEAFPVSRTVHYAVDQRGLAVAVTPYPDDEPDRSILRKEIGRCFYNTDYSNTNAGLSRAEILTAKHKSGVLTGATFVEYYGNRSRYEAYTAAKSEADVRKTSLQPELWLWKDSLPSVSQRPSTKNDQVKSEGQKTVGFKEPEIEAPSLTTTIKDEDQHA